MVVVGHWLNSIVLVDEGTPTGVSALEAVGYMRWLTLLFQIMPLFFVAAGYAAAAAWPSWEARGGRWAGWAHARLVRVLRPTTWFVAILGSATGAAVLLDVDGSVLDQAGWAVALQLWFLPVFLLLIVLAVPMLAAWSRFGWWVVAGAVLLVGAIDVLVRVVGFEPAGWVSYLLAPGAGMVLGIAWHDGALTGMRTRVGLLVAGLLSLLGLIALAGYPPWMIGVPGEPTSNTSPPNLALMAYASAQVGLALLLEPVLRPWLDRPRVWTVVILGNSRLMTLYLWHMVPVVVLAAALAAAGFATGPAPGSAAWWALRIPWITGLALLLLVLVALVGRFERPLPPRADLAGALPSVLLLVSALLAGYALSRLALDGFAPAGALAVGPLLTFLAGVSALWLAGRFRSSEILSGNPEAGDRNG